MCIINCELCIVHCELLKLFLPHESDTLHSGGLTEGVFVHGVGITLDAPLAVFGQQHFHIEVAEERLVGNIVVAIAEVTVDHQPVHRLQLELRLIFLTRTGVALVCSDSHTEGKHVRQFG